MLLRERPWWRRSVLSLLTSAIVVCAAACDGDIAEPPPPTTDADALAVALSEFMPTANSADAPAVFVVSIADPIALDDQVAIIDSLGDGFDVKFVDDAEAAIDHDGPDQPPMDDGLLIGVGAVPSDPPYVVRVEVYHEANDVDGYLVTLSKRPERWVADSTVAVAPEVLSRES